ncbi:MAG: GNAT family N-acetyltransferase [Verrucomicrobiales bacterium]|nr:GNAT family N-acetyltransferase [Verrucomicrobiales bacterium]
MLSVHYTLPDGLALRPADDANDHGFLLDLFKETRSGLFAAADLDPHLQDKITQTQFDAQNAGFRRSFPNGQFNLITLDGEPIGQWYTDENPLRAEIVYATITAAHRRNGIVAALTRQLARHTKNHNKRLLAFVEKLNPARDIWRHLGFHVIEDHTTHERLEHQPYALSLPPNLNAITLRPATREDIPFRFELFKQARRRTFDAISLPPDQLAALVAQQFDSCLLQWQNQHPQATCYLVLDSGEPIGEWYITENQESTYIVNASLLDSHQGKGISAALHRALFARADRISKPVRSHVEKANPAKDILVHLGLKVVADHHTYLELEYQTTIRGARQASITENSISSS